jgi:hypothetical protein
MKDRKIYEQFSAAHKAGDKKARKAAIDELNAKTTRKREKLKAGRLFG